MKNLITVMLMASGLALGQSIPGGTIDGKAIPERVFRSPRICNDLNGVIRDQARDDAARAFGITISPEDIAKEKTMVEPVDPVSESARIREHAALLLSALAAVSRGQDQRQVYGAMLQPKGVPEGEWDTQLKRGRANLERELTMTPDAVAKGVATAIEHMARYRKLDSAVDQEIATRDPQFRTALGHWTASERVEPNGRVGHGIQQVEKDYLEAQRAAWWRSRESKLTVTLNDPTLAARCNLVATK